METEIKPNKVVKWVISGMIGLVILITLSSGFGTVKAGNRGVKTQFGAVVGEVNSGLYFKTPFIDEVHEIDVQTQKEQANAEAASSDLQTVHTTVALNYNVYPDKVMPLYKEIGEDYKTRVIDPAIQESVKSITAKYTAEQLITKRAEVQDAIRNAIGERLAPKYIQVTDLSVINFDFSAQFNQAIEAKVTAVQNADAAKNKLAQVQYEAQQAIAKAQGDAEAIKIQSQAINSQGGADYVQLMALKQWDGHLPQQMIPGQTLPFINIGK